MFDTQADHPVPSGLIAAWALPEVLLSLLVVGLIAAIAFALLRLRWQHARLRRAKEQRESGQVNTIAQLFEKIGRLETCVIQRDQEVERLTGLLQEARRRAEEADMLKSNFLANMSHEIRTPMNGILGFAQLLQSPDMDQAKRDRYLDIICHNGAMLVNLIDDIMDLSRIEAGHFALNPTPVNVDDLMFEVLTFFNEIKYKQEKDHITIRLLNLNDERSATLCADGHRLRQVLCNLIGNALKFTDRGVVEFGYVDDRAERALRFFVRDTGIGIPPDMKELIFERFRQVHEGSTRMYGGTGIGLFIGRHIVQRMGGEIWVESALGQGSMFQFTIPYHQVRAGEGHSQLFIAEPRSYHWEGRTILVAEDEHSNFELLQAILFDTQAAIVWARDGEEAVRLCAAAGRLDVVLMDIQMPKLNGFEAVAQIKRLRPDVPVIAQTAYSMPNDNLRCIEAGCSDYISKPISPSLLLEKINAQLERSGILR